MRKKLLLILPPGPMAEELIGLLEQDFDIERTDNEDTGFGILYDEYDVISAVLVDLGMLRSSDYKIIKKMDEDKIFASIPVIAISDHPVTPEDMECYDRGCTELLTPPGYHQMLYNRINNAIRAKDSFTYSEMQKMMRQLPANLFLKDAEGKYIFSTQYWHHLHKGDERHWTIRGKTDIEIRKDKQNALKAMEADKRILETGVGTDYIIEENDDGVQEFLELIKRPVFDENGNVSGIIALINDVTEKELMKLELERRSRTDGLTGLLNKGAVEDLARMKMAGCTREGKKAVLMINDVDDFKNVNDSFGHIVGDRVLATIGRIINNCFKGSDVVGRIGGDEFLVLLRDIDSHDAVRALADTLQNEVLNAFSGDLERCVSLSIGIAVCPEHGTTYEKLFAAADDALYYVKSNGKMSSKIYGE